MLCEVVPVDLTDETYLLKGCEPMCSLCVVKAGTQQADKELDSVVAPHRLRLDQKAVLEHAARTTADCKQACAFRICV